MNTSGSGDISIDSNLTLAPTLYWPSVILSIPISLQLLLCGIVVKVFFHNPSLLTVTNLTIINLIVSDILRSLVGISAVTFLLYTRTTTPSHRD
jgi:hypothetical protein